jgi:hypothetical protein
MRHRALSTSFFFLAGLAVFVGCSADGGFLGDLTGGGDDDGQNGASLPPSSSGSSGTSSSGGTGDAGKPKKPDGSVEDAGPPPPEPGDTCAASDQIFKRSCGACGSQEAICLKTESGKLEVSDYGVCLGEKVGGCIPGSVVEDSCGNCGKLTKTCTKYCDWQKTTCGGEPANACPAGQIAWATSGCTSGVTKRTCSDVCQWSSFTGTCSAPDYQLKVADAAGKSASVVFPLVATLKTKKVTGNCTTGATLSTSDQHVVAYVTVRNDNAQTAKVSVWNSQASGGSVIDTVLTAYAAIPTGDAALRACLGSAGTYCSTGALPCGDAKFGSLTAANAVSIPAGESRVIAVTTELVHQAGNLVEGPIALNVRTDSFE